ncbi:unnamed protein product [Candidula unifasciata]|uniref:Equilibrative nucleoside transporter 3 n=1 Tax=Candidula unifasciata TaxID=100452 RepID=A0A8S3ZRB1_9EUPU|nr:unnamed protein product [Candidula unifasciata]
MMAYERLPEDGSPRHGQENSPLLRSPSAAGQPPDKRYGVFLIFGFLGLASLLPWNFFITAKKYFDYKFRNTSLPVDAVAGDESITTMQQEFESYLSIVSNVSNLLFMIATVLLVQSISVKVRIVVSTVLITVIFIVTTALVEVDTDSWQDTFFIVTLVIATVMSGLQSVLTGSVLGLSTIFPPMYSQSAMIGQAAGGTFSAVVNILTLAGGGDAVSSALVYFLIAAVIIVLSLISYVCLHFMDFSRFYMVTQGSSVQEINEDISLNLNGVNKVEYFVSIIKKVWMYSISVCLVFTVTLSVFPAICSLIKSSSDDSNAWTRTYFTPVVCFLLFNVGDFIGRLSTFIVKYPGSHRPALLLFFCVLRIGFIPLLMLCNVQPRHLTFVLDNDAYPIVLITLLGLTNGYLGTLCMSFGPIGVRDEHLEGAGMMLALAMTIGLAAGSGLSMLFVKIV